MLLNPNSSLSRELNIIQEEHEKGEDISPLYSFLY